MPGHRSAKPKGKWFVLTISHFPDIFFSSQEIALMRLERPKSNSFALALVRTLGFQCDGRDQVTAGAGRDESLHVVCKWPLVVWAGLLCLDMRRSA